MKTFYLVLPKNPYRRWLIFRRFGPDEAQDCYLQCKKVAERLMADPNTIAIVPTNFRIVGEKETEMEYYLRTLQSHGVPRERITAIHSGLETIHQMQIGSAAASTNGDTLVIFACSVHARRVKKMAEIHKIKARIEVSDGIARPWDVFIEALFIPIYPLFHFEWFRSSLRFFARGLRNLKAMSFLR